MANFGLGGSPAFSTFRANFGLGQIGMSDIIARVWPNNDSYYDISALSSYRNQTLFRYNVYTNNSGFGNVQVNFPFTSARTASVLTPWFRVGNPPYITVTAFPFYPRSFSRWQDGNGSILSYSQSFNVGWNATGTLDLIAILF